MAYSKIIDPDYWGRSHNTNIAAVMDSPRILVVATTRILINNNSAHVFFKMSQQTRTADGHPGQLDREGSSWRQFGHIDPQKDTEQTSFLVLWSAGSKEASVITCRSGHGKINMSVFDCSYCVSRISVDRPPSEPVLASSGVNVL